MFLERVCSLALPDAVAPALPSSTPVDVQQALSFPLFAAVALGVVAAAAVLLLIVYLAKKKQKKVTQPDR